MNIKQIAVTALSVTSLSSAVAVYAGPQVEVDNNGVILAGHDAVAYFSENAAVEGSAQFTAVHNDAIYRFKSAENRDTFKANPSKYAPQFGGFCALGAAYGKKFDIDGKAFKVVDGKLYVNKNEDVAESWLEDEVTYITDAKAKWSSIKDVPASEL